MVLCVPSCKGSSTGGESRLVTKEGGLVMLQGLSRVGPKASFSPRSLRPMLRGQEIPGRLQALNKQCERCLDIYVLTYPHLQSVVFRWQLSPESSGGVHPETPILHPNLPVPVTFASEWLSEAATTPGIRGHKPMPTSPEGVAVDTGGRLKSMLGIWSPGLQSEDK